MQLTINKNEVTPNQDTYINTVLKGKTCEVDYCGLSMNGRLVGYHSHLKSTHGFRVVGQKKFSLGYDNLSVYVTGKEMSEYEALGENNE